MNIMALHAASQRWNRQFLQARDVYPGAGGYFTMGRWGLAINVAAVCWGTGMAINLAWPRELVYGNPWYNTWGAYVYIVGILGAGLIWYFLRGRQRIGTLASHASAM